MNQRILAFTYGYIVCLTSLGVCAYALLTLLPTSGPLAEKPQPIEVSIMSLDTMATDTMATYFSGADPTASSDPEKAQELRNLRLSKDAFDDARKTLETERTRLADLRLRIHIIQGALILLFASAVFIFHWQWMRRMNHAAA